MNSAINMNSAGKAGKNCLPKPQVKCQIFMGPMAKTQLLKITKHHAIAFDKKNRS
jgi:hypothetical protein